MKLFHRFLLVLALNGLIYNVSAHPYHVSIGEVRYNAKTRNLEVALKMFTDDLEKTLSESEKKPVALSTAANKETLLTNYLKKNFVIEINNKASVQRFIGSEVDNDAHWFYLEIPVKPEDLNKITIRNQILMETFEDQMNILNLDLSGRKQTMLFKSNDFRKAVSQ